MTKQRETRGRPKGSRNKGYFFRPNRGWFAKNSAGKQIPLADLDGNRLRNKNTPDDELKLAHARFLTSDKPRTVKSGVTIMEVCDHYLAAAEKSSAASTVDGRGRTLFDFCYGFPGKFRKNGEKPTKADRIHKGYGMMLVEDLKPHHLQAWQNAHGGWTADGSRTRIVAIKRALNFCKEQGFIERNPLRGMKVPQNRRRVTYLNDEQEGAILARSPFALKRALRVLIRTGMRPHELAQLERRHVVDHGDKMEFKFKPEESKTRKERTIFVTEPWIMELVRKQMKEHREHVFRNAYGEPWRIPAMSEAFRRAKKKAKKAGVQFDDDLVLYSTRHTYAKRCLCGYWRGQFINIETLARLMGNTPEVCRKNYLQWTQDYQEPLWAAC